jgi:hypothetical protein
LSLALTILPTLLSPVYIRSWLSIIILWGWSGSSALYVYSFVDAFVDTSPRYMTSTVWWTRRPEVENRTGSRSRKWGVGAEVDAEINRSVSVKESVDSVQCLVIGNGLCTAVTLCLNVFYFIDSGGKNNAIYNGKKTLLNNSKPRYMHSLVFSFKSMKYRFKVDFSSFFFKSKVSLPFYHISS